MSGVRRAPARVVCSNALVERFGVADVECAVVAAEDVDMESHRCPSMRSLG